MRLKRKQAYSSLFDGFVSEQEQLEAMYAPLRDVLGAEEGTLGKLTFSVRRIVDVEAWSRQGESLLDLRTGVFRGHGELLKQVETIVARLGDGRERRRCQRHGDIS